MESVRPQADLRGALLPGNIQDARVPRKVRARLHQKRGFPDPGIAAQQHHHPADQAPAQHAIQLADAR